MRRSGEHWPPALFALIFGALVSSACAEATPSAPRPMTNEREAREAPPPLGSPVRASGPAEGPDDRGAASPVASPVGPSEPDRPGDRGAPPPIRIALEHEEAIDRAVNEAIAAGAAPGCVVVIGRSDGVLFRRAYGARATEPSHEPMSADTIFDLASLTKAVATTSAIFRLVELQRVELDAAVARYLPEFTGSGREAITVRHLLTHTSGLPPADPLSAYEDDRERSIARILRIAPRTPPGTRVRYSDLGFIVLGALVERVSGQSLDAFVRAEIFEKLSMHETFFVPPRALHERVAPTERAPRRGGAVIRGVVHDPRAYRLGGIAGNAGLFSSADDLARFARLLLAEGSLERTRIFRPETVRAMRARQPGSERALGWDMNHPSLSAAAFGHGGFTGTSLWIDPELDVFVLLLSNRVHPNGRGNVQPLVRELGRLAREARGGAMARAEARVLNGIDVLRREGFAPLAGAEVVLLTHDAARARDGRRTLDLFASTPALRLVRVLSPEHGLSGRQEGHVRDGRDERTGVEVHSLFGPRREPNGAVFEGADTLVVDLVDVGVRFYTYASSMRRAVEAALARGMRAVVLDRPNPLGGREAFGIVSEPALGSFVNHHPLPTVHGMTLGELSQLVSAARGLSAAPTIVPVEGWRREMPFAETGLRWVAPSPNLRRAEVLPLYPALGMLEGTNVSVGRGTDHPFELIGAPWMNPEAVLRELGPIEGARVEPARFTPTSARHRRVMCRGLRFTLIEPERFHPVRTALALARALLRVHPGEWEAERMRALLGDRAIFRALREGAEPDELLDMARPALARFTEQRRAHLLYE